MSWQCQCGVANKPRAAFCEVCGEDRRDSAIATPEARRICPFDGATLHANGWCPIGQGIPITQTLCPDVCPYCRKNLSWNGDCYACMPPGEKPGHLYDHDGQHWRTVERGPTKIGDPHVALQALEAISNGIARAVIRGGRRFAERGE